MYAKDRLQQKEFASTAQVRTVLPFYDHARGYLVHRQYGLLRPYVLLCVQTQEERRSFLILNE